MIDTIELMRKVGNIRILTSHLVDEQLTGDYHSSFRGQGIEFDEVREYTFGDDIRDIDWNVTARTGFPYVKRYSEERELTVMFVVDVSGSQSYGSASRLKSELAAELTCLLSLTSIRNQDNIGLILFSDRIVKTIPPRKGRKAVMRLVREVLAADEAYGGTDIAGALNFLASILHRKAVVFLVSDFQDTGWEKRIGTTAQRHDLICCYLSDPYEKTLPNVGLVELEDPETGEAVWIDTSSKEVRNAFEANAEKRTGELKDIFKSNGIDTMFFSTDEDPIHAVRAFFRQRARRR
ncbi:MAG: DUF58 domain-containing protein [Lentisphaerae bacterium]|jgi:uncharacterized protein (DUF58 family)|nr:DUF58 domain-containing protein [Lentisphaerota bacterium]